MLCSRENFEATENVSAANAPNAESTAVCQQATGIHFQRFKKLKEPLVVERTIEVLAHLRSEESGVVLRLEALRSAPEPGYAIAVYRQDTVSVPTPYHASGHPAPPHDVRIWAAYDLIRSDRGTAEQALEQVLGFLEMRCG